MNQIYPTVAFKLLRPSLISLNHQYYTCMKSYKTTQAQLTSIKRIHTRKRVFTTQHLRSWKPLTAAVVQVGGLWCLLISSVL